MLLFMNKLPLAALRMSALILALIIATLLILLFALFPIRIRGGIRLPIYPAIWFAYYLMAVLDIRYTCTDPEKLRSHQGLLISNHLSYMDILALLRTVPARFMSTIGVKKIPLIGWVASVFDTIFVNRGSKESRNEARAELSRQLEKRPFPPIAIFPEGRIGDGTTLHPFRHGSFNVALQQNIDCLVCAIRYEPYQLVSWTDKEETLPQAVWRLATADQTLHITIVPLDILNHHSHPDAASMADAAQTLIETALR